MPDQADVEVGLAAFLAGALYPKGVGAASAVGTVCRVYRGAPVVGALGEDLVAGIAHVTVAPVAGSVKATTRFSPEWQGSVGVCPLVVAVEGVTAIFSGAAAPGMVAGVIVDEKAHVWRVTDAVTPAVVAAVIADLVRVDRPAVLSGDGVTFPGAFRVVARAVSDGSGGEELRRQEGRFRVTVWCPSPEVRDVVGAFVDLALAGLVFLDVGGWGCRVLSAGETSHDEGAAVRAWRRELYYTVEWPTVLYSDLPSMLFGAGSVNGAGYLG